MLPEGWKRVTLDKCVDLLTGYAFSSDDYVEPSELSIRLLRGDNIVPGSLRWDDAKHYPQQCASNLARYELREGDVVIALDRPVVGAGLKCCTVKCDDLPCILVQRVARLRASGSIDQNYLAQVMQTSKFASHLLSQKTESAVPHISPNDIRNYDVVLPQMQEQRWISSMLETWDKAIAVTGTHLANIRQQKQVLLRGLLSGKRRFETLAGSWQHLDFDSLFERVTRKNKVGNTNVLTISGQHGLISQREYFNKNVASENLSGYTLLERGEFAYNKSYSAGYPMGAIKPLLAYDVGVVSSLYLCFRIREDVEADFDFFRHYFEAGFLDEEISGIAQEGARNHGLLNVSIPDFFKLRLHIPPLPVQRKIAEVLNVAEHEERACELQLEQLRTEKRALMQQVLTGKRRVRVPESEAEASPA